MSLYLSIYLYSICIYVPTSCSVYSLSTPITPGSPIFCDVPNKGIDSCQVNVSRIAHQRIDFGRQTNTLKWITETQSIYYDTITAFIAYDQANMAREASLLYQKEKINIRNTLKFGRMQISFQVCCSFINGIIDLRQVTLCD